jgi:hypothetical protein
MGVGESGAGAPERFEQGAIRDAYGFALVFVLGSTLLLIASGAPVDSWVALAAIALQFAALRLTLRVSGVSRRWSLLGSIAGLLVLVVGVAALFAVEDIGRLVALVVWILLALSTIAAVASRVRTYRYVSLQSVMGLLVIYVLLGVTFGLLYLLFELVDPPAFAQGEQGVSGAMYMSFITLATVGYGDVSPGSDVVRSLAIAESIIGQLYLVSVVSLAVSRLGRRKEDRQGLIDQRHGAADAESAPLTDGGGPDV